MSKSLKKLIDINRLREFKNKLVGTGSAYVQTGTVDQTVAGTKTFSKPIVGSVTGSSGSCTGNAATATKLATARTINGTSFNGTANITTANWGTARNISITDGTNTSTAVSVNGSANVSLNLPATIKANLTGNCSGSSGSCTGNAATATTATTAQACTGNAATATKLATARSINIQDSSATNTGTAASFDGSGNATIKLPATIKASITGDCSGSSGSCTGNAASATITKGNKNTGSYVTSVKSGNALVNADNTQFATIYNAPTKSYRVGCATWPDNGENIVWYSITNANVSSSTNTINKTMTWNAGTGVLTATGFSGPLTGNVTGNCSGSSGSCTGNAATATTATTAKACTGNAATATKLATARSLWGNNFDGSAAISGTITGTPSIEFKPVATTANNGGLLDFHYNQSTADYTSRIIESASGTLSINNVTITTGKVVTATTFNGALKGNVTGNCSGSSGSCTGNAATATKLAAKRTIALSGAATGTATAFDGSGNITIPVTSLDASKLTGTASVSTTGNAATATTATTAKSCTGNAATATKATQDAAGNTITTTYATKSEIIVHVGVIIPFAGKSVPTGYLLCNGAAVSRTNYANLFAAIGTLYGAGNGSTTFNLPDARDRVLQGASGGHSAGSYIAAGLPNITGSMQPMYWDNASSTGAMNGQARKGNVNGVIGDAMGQVTVTFNASRSSSYYGASTKPQVDAIATNFIIKY